MPNNKNNPLGFSFQDIANMGGPSTPSQFGEYGGMTPTAPLKFQQLPQQQAPMQEPEKKKKAARIDSFLGGGGELIFNDNGAKREVLRTLDAPEDTQKIEYKIDRATTEIANKPYYYFFVTDSKGKETEIETVSGEVLEQVFSGLTKGEKDKEAYYKRSRRAREKGGEWRRYYEKPFEDGLIQLNKNTDWTRDLQDFAGRAYGSVFGTSSDMIAGGVQGAFRAASNLTGGREGSMAGEFFDDIADSRPLTKTRELAQFAQRNMGFENEIAQVGGAGVGSLGTIAALNSVPGLGYATAALSAYESGVEKSRELAARAGERSSNMDDLAMGVGYGAVEFAMERMGGRAIKAAIKPSVAKKVGQKMFDAAMDANPALMGRFLAKVKDVGGAAFVNYMEEFSTNVGQEVLNDIFYDVDRDLGRSIQEANMAGIGGAFGGTLAAGGATTARSAQEFSDRTRRSMLGDYKFSGQEVRGGVDTPPVGTPNYSKERGYTEEELNRQRERRTPTRMIGDVSSYREPTIQEEQTQEQYAEPELSQQVQEDVYPEYTQQQESQPQTEQPTRQRGANPDLVGSQTREARNLQAEQANRPSRETGPGSRISSIVDRSRANARARQDGNTQGIVENNNFYTDAPVTNRNNPRGNEDADMMFDKIVSYTEKSKTWTLNQIKDRIKELSPGRINSDIKFDGNRATKTGEFFINKGDRKVKIGQVNNGRLSFDNESAANLIPGYSQPNTSQQEATDSFTEQPNTPYSGETLPSVLGAADESSSDPNFQWNRSRGNGPRGPQQIGAAGPLDIDYEDVTGQIPNIGNPDTGPSRLLLPEAEERRYVPTGSFISPNVFSEQENYAITRLQRLGFTEGDAIEEVKANRYGRKANTASYQRLIEGFPESAPAVESLMSKAKKVYGTGKSKARSIFTKSIEDVDASIDAQVEAGANITSTPPTAAASTTPPGAPPVTPPVTPEGSPSTEEQSQEDPLSEYDFSEEDLNQYLDEEDLNTEEVADATTEDPATATETTATEEAPAESNPLTNEQSTTSTTAESSTTSAPTGTKRRSTKRAKSPSPVKPQEYKVDKESEEGTKAGLIVDASNGLSDEQASKLQFKGTSKRGAIAFKPEKGRAIEIAEVVDGKIVVNEKNVENRAKLTNSQTNTSNSTEGTQPGKRQTAAERAKNKAKKNIETINKAIDSAIQETTGQGAANSMFVPPAVLKAIYEGIRKTGVTVNQTVINALDAYIELQAQAVISGANIKQALANIKAYISTNITNGAPVALDSEISNALNETITDIPKRAARAQAKQDKQTKAAQNKANKAALDKKKSDAKKIIEGIINKANAGGIKGFNEITIYSSLINLDKKLDVEKAFIRKVYNDALANIKTPNTKNIEKSSLAQARKYVTDYANALLLTNKNDLIKNKHVAVILSRIDKINTYSGIVAELARIKKIMDSANYSNRLNDAKKAIAKAISARKSTPGLGKVVQSLQLMFAIADSQDINMLKRIEDVSKLIQQDKILTSAVIAEINSIKAGLVFPEVQAKEETTSEKKIKTPAEIKASKDKLRDIYKELLSISSFIKNESLKNLFGINERAGFNNFLSSIDSVDLKDTEDIDVISTLMLNAKAVFDATPNGPTKDMSKILIDLMGNSKTDQTKEADAILRLQARANAQELEKSNVGDVISGVSKLFDSSNKNLAVRIVAGKWLGENKRRTLQQTIDRLVNYGKEAGYQIEKSFRLPLLAAFTRSESASQQILHNLSEQIKNAKLSKTSYTDIQVFGMVVDYLDGFRTKHSFALFNENALDIRRKIENGLKDKNKSNKKDAKVAIEWFDKNLGKYDATTKSFDGPLAKIIQAKDGKDVDTKNDINSFLSVIPNRQRIIISTMYDNFREIGAKVIESNRIYKGQTIDSRPFYWPRKAVSKLDTASDTADKDNFLNEDVLQTQLEAIMEHGLNGKKFDQVSTRQNPHTLARTQNDKLVYSLNAYDVASTFYTNGNNDIYVTPELIKVGKTLAQTKELLTTEGSKALRKAIVNFTRASYNVGFKKFQSPLLKAIDPLIGESARLMLGSYSQVIKQSAPAILGYVLSGEGNIADRARTMQNVLRDKENMAILLDILAIRSEKAKDKLRQRFLTIREETGLDFGISRSNAVIDSFRELSAQQSGGNYITDLAATIDKIPFLGNVSRFGARVGDVLPTTDSYTRLLIYASEIERLSGKNFAQFISEYKGSEKGKERIFAEADKAVNRVMGSSFSKERSSNLTMNTDSDIENLWKKVNFFMSNALSQNSTTFRDSVTAAILDPANRPSHIKRAGMVTANAVVYSGISSAVAGIFGLLGAGLGFAFGMEEDEEENEESLERGLLGSTAKVTTELFYGNRGNAFNSVVSFIINLGDKEIRKANKMTDKEVMQATREIFAAYRQGQIDKDERAEKLLQLQEDSKVGNRTLIYTGGRGFGPTAELRPIVGLSGAYKSVGNVAMDIVDLTSKYNSENPPTALQHAKLVADVMKIVPLAPPDAVRLVNSLIKQKAKQIDKENAKKPNRR